MVRRNLQLLSSCSPNGVFQKVDRESADKRNMGSRKHRERVRESKFIVPLLTRVFGTAQFCNQSSVKVWFAPQRAFDWLAMLVGSAIC